MDSTDTIDTDNGNSTGNHESLPTTTSVLDKSRSLFGKPSNALSTPVRDPTPDAKDTESNSVTNSSVAMDTDQKNESSDDTASNETREKHSPKVSSNTEGTTPQSSLDNKSGSPKSTEETFEKKVISMDTSGAGSIQASSEKTGNSLLESKEGSIEKADEDVASKSDNDLVIDEDDYNDDEEEEVPKKKPKRTAVSDDDEDYKSDEQEMGDDSRATDDVGNTGSTEQIAAQERDSPEPSFQESSTISDSNGDTKVASDVSSEVQTEPTKEEDSLKNSTEDASAGNIVKDAVVDVTVDQATEVVNNNDDVPNDDIGTNVDNVAEHSDKSVDVANKEEEISNDAEIAGGGGNFADEDPEAVDEGNEGEDEDEEQQHVTPQQVQEPKSTTRSTRSRKEATAVSTPSSSTPKRGGRGRKVTIDAQEDEATEEKVETPKKGRLSRKLENEEDPEEQDVTEKLEKGTTSSKRGRPKRSVASINAHEEVSDEANATPDATEETPKRGLRARRSEASATSTPTTPRSGRGNARKSQVSEEVDEEPADSAEADANEGVEEEDDDDDNNVTKKTTRTPRTRKSIAKADPVNEDNAEETAPQSSSRRSTRAKATPHSAKETPVVENKRTPARGKKQVSVMEEATDDTVQTTLAKKGRKTTKNVASSRAKNEEYDPYDLDTEMEHHPEPLKNIHMEVQNFGAVKYAKAGQSESKYSMTEKAAESRIASLQTSPTSKNKRSLADMTPGREKTNKRTSTGIGRRAKAKKEEHPGNDVEMEDFSNLDSPETPSTNRGRKRKSEGSELATPASKRELQFIAKALSTEEQLQADHPQDENEPHSVGARVYANFQKMFYPAVILEEQDGLGRFKLQYTNDNVVKDVPNSGIIPLRDLTPGKTVTYDDKDARLVSGPNDISAEEWSKGLVTITILDDEGEPTDEIKTVNWKDLSFDQSEFRDYIKSIEKTAASIATSNITSIGHTSRVRKPTYVSQQMKQTVRRKKGANPVSSSDASEAPVEEDDEDKLLPMKEEAIGKNIFAGKVFMLTSANRSSAVNVSPMFKKKNLMDFITENGGVVTEQHSSFQELYSDREPLLISDTYYRTHKYLAALARGIPCVNNVWLQVCGEQGECVDHKPFVLPAGASIFGDQTDCPAPQNPGELLKGKTIYIHSTHSVREITQSGPGGTFIEIWKPILELLGATVIDGDYEQIIKDNVQFDVALVDGTFREEVVHYADRIGASKVTSEWVIQTIILGEAPAPTAHQKFDPYRLHHRTRYD